MTRARCSTRASVRFASTAPAATRRARRGWRPGWRPIQLISAARSPLRADGCDARAGSWRRSSRGRTTAGLPFTRSTSFSCRATPRAVPRWRGRLQSWAGASTPTWRCSAWRSKARCSSPAPRSSTACGASTKRRRPRSRARRRSRSRGRGPAVFSSAPASPCVITSAHTSGATGLRSSSSDMAAGTCWAFAGSTTPRWTCGADVGATRKRSSKPRSRRMRGRGRAAWAVRLPGWASCAAGRAGGKRPNGCSARPARWRCSPGARLALDRGDARHAANLAERTLRQTPAHTVLHRAPALEVLIRRRGRTSTIWRGRAALEELKTVASRVGTAPLLAAASLAEGVVAAAGGEHERAGRLFEDAIDGFERSGAPFEAAAGTDSSSPGA